MAAATAEKRLTTAATKYRAAVKNARAERKVLDAVVKEAAVSGLSYRDIAKVISMSVAWVQLSLTRSGHTVD